MRLCLLPCSTSASWARKLRFLPIPGLLWIESERFELPVPLGGSIAEPLDANASWQTTFDCSTDEFGREEGQRDGHIDMPDAAFLARRDLFKFGNLA